MHVAYKKQSLTIKVTDGEPQVKLKKLQKQKSIYTIAREGRFKKAALKKYADRIKEIQKYFPDWVPSI